MTARRDFQPVLCRFPAGDRLVSSGVSEEVPPGGTQLVNFRRGQHSCPWRSAVAHRGRMPEVIEGCHPLCGPSRAGKDERENRARHQVWHSHACVGMLCRSPVSAADLPLPMPLSRTGAWHSEMTFSAFLCDLRSATAVCVTRPPLKKLTTSVLCQGVPHRKSVAGSRPVAFNSWRRPLRSDAAAPAGGWRRNPSPDWPRPGG